MRQIHKEKILQRHRYRASPHSGFDLQDGRYLGIADGRPPKGFRGEIVQIGVKRRERGSDHKRVEFSPRLVQRFVVDEQWWTRCYQAWLMRHEGHTIQEIHRATRLFKNDRGYVPFFRRRLYTGDYGHGGVIYENFVPALIPRSWYEEEQARRQERGKKRKGQDMTPDLEPRRVASKSLLSGKLVCETVAGEQHRMHAHRSPATKGRTKSNTYECATHKHTHGEGCPFYGLSQPALDRSVIDVILRDIITRDTLRPLVDALNSQLASQHTAFTAQLNTLQTHIAEAEKQRRKYAKLIDEDEDPSSTLVAELKRYERDKATLLEQKRQLETSGPAAISAQPISDAQLDDYVARVRDVLLGRDEILARRILDHFIAKVCVKQGSSTGTLYYTFPSAFFAPDLSPLRMSSLAGGKGRSGRLH